MRPLINTLRTGMLAVCAAFLGHASAQDTLLQHAPRWMPYSDSVGAVLQLTPEQRRNMEDIDRRYQAQFNGLGTDAARQRQYPTMQQQRDTDIRRVLGDRYSTWRDMDKHYVPGTAHPLPINGGRPGVDQQGAPSLPPPPPQLPPTATPGNTTK